MISDKEMQMLAFLRQNSRMPLTKLSRKIDIPVSTIFDRLRSFRRDEIIKRNAIIFDFHKIGFTARASILISVEKYDRDKLVEYFVKHNNVNTLCHINNGYDFLVECVFETIRDLEQFTEQFESKFRIKAKEVHYIIDDLKREGFLADPSLSGSDDEENDGRIARFK